MPFSKSSVSHDEVYWKYFYKILKVIVEKLGYECTRAENHSHNIVGSVIKMLETSDLVIAVLTDMNPNVFYELGIRHSLKNGTIMLIEKGQEIPFDISNYGLIRYEDRININDFLEKEIESIIKKSESISEFDSPVFDNLELKPRHNNEISELRRIIMKLVDEREESVQIMRKHRVVKNILWVDDFLENNYIIMDLFRSNAINFTTVTNSDEAINALSKSKYDLIITDIGRDNEDDAGIKMIESINASSFKEIPIIVFSTHAAISKYGEKARILGAKVVTNKMTTLINEISRFYDLNFKI